jgi:hypothetical protein
MTDVNVGLVQLHKERPTHRHPTAVGRWPRACRVPLQATVPGWLDPRGAGATRLHRPVGGAGSQAALESHALPWRVRA